MVNINVNDNTNQIRINVNPTSNNVFSTIGNETFYNGLAKAWAIKMDGKVQGEDYSSKYYAGQSANSASEAASAVEGFEDTVTEATQQALDTLDTTKQTIIDELGEEETNIISDLNTEKTSIISDIQEEGTTQVNAVTNTGTSYVTEMTALKDAAQGYATNAGNSATAAATSEDNAEIWAEGTDAQVQALGGVHSAKGWAEESATGQINANWTENDPTSKAYIFNKPTKLSDFNNDSGFATEQWVSNQNYVNSTTLATTLLDYVTNTSLTTTLADYQPLLVSGTNIKTLNGNSILGSGDLTLDGLPSQTGQSGKFLTTDGTDASWGNLPVATASTVGVVKPDNASIRVSNDGTLSAICRNVGEIISSTLPLTDAGLHLLDGSLLQYGIYKEFIDYIADLYAENPSANYFTTESAWQQSVTTYGSCGKFVYDSVNNTVRLPKVSDILQGTTDVSALGDLVEAGLPDHNHNVFAFYWGSQGSQAEEAQAPPNFGSNINIGSSYASASNSIYGNSSTVQPQTIKVLYYIVIANSSKTEIQVDIDEIATDLNGKADIDLSNVTDTGYIKMAGAGMPSDTYIDLTLGASGSTYTAPANGYFYLVKRSSSTSQSMELANTSSTITVEIREVDNSSLAYGHIAVKKDDVVNIYYSLGGATSTFRFIYAVGSESEAS